MNQIDLAKASGVAQNTISEIELGKRKARPETLGKLAGALGVSIAELTRPAINERARYLKQEAEHADSLRKAVRLAKKALALGYPKDTTEILDLLDECLQELSESLHDAHRIETGDTRTTAEKSMDDRLSALLAEWETEKTA